MPLQEDFGVFFNPEDFGEVEGDIVFLPATGGEYTIEGIFDDAHSISEPGDFEAKSSLPELWVAEYSVQGVTNADAFRVRGLDYNVRSVEPDGSGFMVIKLTKDEE